MWGGWNYWFGHMEIFFKATLSFSSPPYCISLYLNQDVGLLLGNVLARGIERAPDALVVSGDNSRLAFIGPTEHTVTIMDARSLDEVRVYVCVRKLLNN